MKIKNLATFYVEQGEGATVLFLHGWGSSHLDFLGTANVVKNSFRCINLDLWGFGKSEEPKEVETEQKEEKTEVAEKPKRTRKKAEKSETAE